MSQQPIRVPYQQFSKEQQKMIDQAERIAKYPKSSRSMKEVTVGDLITDKCRLYLVTDLAPYNGYPNSLLTLQNVETGRESWCTSKFIYNIVEVACNIK